MPSKEAKVAAGIFVTLVPLVAGCTPLVVKEVTATPVVRKETPPAPEAEVQQTAAPRETKEAEAQPTPPLEEKRWEMGPLELRWKIGITDHLGNLHRLQIYVTPGRAVEITPQASSLISFFLQFKKPPASLPETLMFIFTNTEPPGAEFYAMTKKELHASAISLTKLERERFGKKKELEPPFPIKVNMAFAAEICNLLLEPTDFAEELQGLEQGLICDSYGIAVGYALMGKSYEDYMEEVVYYRYRSQTGPVALILATRQTYNTIQTILNGKPPIVVEKSTP